MIKSYLNIKRMMVMAVFVMPTLVSAAECLTPELATDKPMSDPPSDCPECMGVANNGFAVAVQADQGQGSIDCSVFIGQSGEPMHEVFNVETSGGARGQGKKGTVADPIRWVTTTPDIPESNIRVVFIGNSGDGSRCTEFFTENATSGYAGSGAKSNKDSAIVFCADGFSEPPEPIPPTPPQKPVITGAGCPEDFQDAVNLDDEYDWIIMGGRNSESGKEGHSAICIDQNVNGGAEQVPQRCVERCITPEEDATLPFLPLHGGTRAVDCAVDNPAALLGGRFPINCRVCEVSGDNGVDSDIFDPETPFCWEQGQDVDPLPATSESTFKLPQPEQGEQEWVIKGRQGSHCYLISGQTYGGWPYSYWSTSDCPH